MSTADILIEVQNERVRQDKKWGGPEHDDKHSVEDDFCFFINTHTRIVQETSSPSQQRKELIEVAALAVAAVERLDRSR